MDLAGFIPILPEGGLGGLDGFENHRSFNPPKPPNPTTIKSKLDSGFTIRYRQLLVGNLGW